MTISGGQPGLASDTSCYYWRDYSNSSLQWNNLPGVSRPIGTLYSSSQGVGGLYSNASQTGIRALLRGGDWYDDSPAGVLALSLDFSPGVTGSRVGLRVSR